MIGPRFQRSVIRGFSRSFEVRNHFCVFSYVCESSVFSLAFFGSYHDALISSGTIKKHFNASSADR